MTAAAALAERTLSPPGAHVFAPDSRIDLLAPRPGRLLGFAFAPRCSGRALHPGVVPQGHLVSAGERRAASALALMRAVARWRRPAAPAGHWNGGRNNRGLASMPGRRPAWTSVGRRLDGPERGWKR